MHRRPPFAESAPLGRSLGASSILMALVAGNGAFGQALKPYRVHVLKNSAGADFVVHGVESILVPNPDGNAIAINDKGVIGGTFETGPSTGIYHGFVWFPNTLGLSNFAFPTGEVIDIHPYAFPGGTTDSTIVNDVADDDALIGFRGATPGADGHAYLFPMTVTLPTPTIGAVDLHTTTGDYSIGFGVRESSPLQIVGLTTVACEDKSELHPFVTTWSSGGGAGSMQLLPIPATKASGSASDIARTGSAFLVSGEDNICGVDTSDCSIVPCTFFCLQSNLGALRWTSASVFEVLDSPDVCTAPPVPSAAQGRGINASGDVTGWGVVDEDPAQRRAMFWAAGATTVTRPGDTMPSMPAQESWAEAISQRYIDGCVALVGMNLQTDAGLI